jgi:acyl-CoA hydrolase
MENYKLILPEHLNQYGFLFGGHLLSWVDEIAWIAATLRYPGCRFVTVGMDRVEFKRPVGEGAILKFDVREYKRGRTSTTWEVTVKREDEEPQIFSTHVTLVRLDENGEKTALPAL